MSYIAVFLACALEGKGSYLTLSTTSPNPQGKEIIPIHNLRRLAELSVVIHELNHDALIKLDFLSSYYINARYKEDLQQLCRGITEATAQDFIQFTEDLVKWLCQKMR